MLGWQMEGDCVCHYTANAGQTEGITEEAFVFYNIIEIQDHSYNPSSM